ncbi:MAG: DMT family transporter [Bacteroidota bacterium]
MNVYIVLSIQLLIAGGTHIVAKAVVSSVDPAPLTFLRSIFSTFGLIGILLLKQRIPRIDREDWKKLIWIGFLGLPLNQFLYLYGLQHSTAANGALLYATTPVFVLLVSRFLLGERLTPGKTLGVTLALAGVSIVVFERGVDFSSEHTFGNLMILMAVVAWGLFTVQGKPLVLKYGAIQTIAVAMTIGMLLFLPVGIYATAQTPIVLLDLSQWTGIAYLGLGTSVFGYLLWYYAIGKIEVSKVAVFTNGQPIFATILAVIFLDYTITGMFVLGGLITLAGVITTQRS